MDTVFPRIIAVPQIIAPLDGNFLKYSLPLNNRPPRLSSLFYPLVKSDPAKLISDDSSSVAEDIAIEN